MPPIPKTESRTLQAVGARRTNAGAPSRSELVQTLRRFAAEGNGIVALFDARAIAGERHLLSAWAHMGRTRARGESRLRDRGAELALYVAGDDQLPRALSKVGVADDSRDFVLLVERPRETDAVLAAFGLVRDEMVYPRPPSEATLERLGISEAERKAVPSSAWEGLVLERVALLDLSSAHALEAAKQKPAADPV
jgi:tRNA threonylcarbamoyladenosine modification (KEOPS) complex Cgi121 subunit